MSLAGGGGKDTETGGEPGGDKVQKPRKQEISRVWDGGVNRIKCHRVTSSVRSGKFVLS